MGRPRKSDLGPTPTRERILTKSMELFAAKGFDAVTVRDITRSLGLTEATLYVHFKNKADVLSAIFQHLDEQLITPGFSIPQVEWFKAHADLDLASFFISGAKAFFSKTDDTTLLTWKILLTTQYRYKSSRESVENHLLEAPIHFFSGMLQNLQLAGLIGPDIDPTKLGRVLAAIFFQFSFRSMLSSSWKTDSSLLFDELEEEIQSFVDLIQP